MSSFSNAHYPIATTRGSAMMPQKVLLTLCTIIFFAPAALPDAIPLRVVVLMLGIALLIALSSQTGRRDPTSLWPSTLWAVVSAILFFLFQYIGGRLEDSDVALNATRLFIITPTFMTVGYLLVTTKLFDFFAKAILAVASVCAAASLAERFLKRSLFGRSDFLLSQREGSVRAVLLSENVLVLGALLAAAVPLAIILRRIHSVPVAFLLVAGSWATGSRGPTVIAAIIGVLILVPRAHKWVSKNYRWVGVAVLGGFLMLAWLSTYVWKPEIPGLTGKDYSFWYRPAIYALLPDLLQEKPMGYVLGELPPGRWLMYSQAAGIKDAVLTLDSELVYSAFSLGVVGVALYCGAIFFAARALGRDFKIGMTALVTALAGLFLALHAWDTLGPLWYVLVGASICAVRKPRKRSWLNSGAHASSRERDRSLLGARGCAQSTIMPILTNRPKKPLDNGK